MIWTAVFIVVLVFYFVFDPVSHGWMPQCVFHKITGLQCMGCGAQRMAHALLHGDFAGAFRANAFLLISLPFLAALVGVEVWRHRFPRLYSRIHSLGVIITISAMLVAWLIIRNIFSL